MRHFFQIKTILQKRRVVFSIVFLCNYIAVAQNNLAFIQNKGQWDNNIFYKADIGGGSVWLEKNAFTFLFNNQEDVEKRHAAHHGEVTINLNDKFRQHAFKIQFLNTSADNKLAPLYKENTYYNYFLSGKSASNVSAFKKINNNNLYPGIDVSMYTSAEGYLKYDFIVNPNADPSAISWQYQGVEAAISNGNIILNTTAGEVVEQKPIAWQFKNNKKVFVPVEYSLTNNIISFKFPKGFDKTKSLCIDPTLIFSSYTGSTADNWGYTATYDTAGALYSGSISFANGYPTTLGALDITFGGGSTDVTISKFNPLGTALLYSTYLGGNNSEVPHSLITNESGELYVLGTTSSANFPTTVGCYDTLFHGGTALLFDGAVNFSAGSDIFVAKFNSTGTALLGSTFFGGSLNDGLNTAAALRYNYADEVRGEIFLDQSANVYVASSTFSTDFPTTAGALSSTNSGGQDACAFKLNSDLTALAWSTYIGGSNDDAAYSTKIANSGYAYICGGTTSTNFPNTGNGFINTAPGGTVDGFIIKLDDSNGSMVNSTYLGTNNYDQAYLLEIDKGNNIYVVGQTKGAYSVSTGVYTNANSTQFIHKLKPDLDSSIFSTVFGSGSITTINISPSAFLVDICGNIYVSGWGGAINNIAGITAKGNTNGMPTTADAFDATTDGSDFYFIVFTPNASSLLYATYFGSQTSLEHVDGGTSRFDKEGAIYQAVCAGCGNNDTFPTQPGVWSTTNNSSNCNLGAIKMRFDFTGILANANASPNISSCAPLPLTVNFNGNNAAVNHIWNFGDGTPTSSLANPTHTYVDTASYTVMYVAIDSSTCNILDTAYLSVVIHQPPVINTSLSQAPIDPCSNDFTVNMAFTGTGIDSLIWDLGDGTILNDITNDLTVDHTYSSSGTYTISLTTFNFQCSVIDTVSNIVSRSDAPPIYNPASPNVFTPNGDGKNDVFFLFDPTSSGVDISPYFTSFEMKIYNRWGKLVYESNENKWNGLSNDQKQLSDGVYFYLIKYQRLCADTEFNETKGFITVIR